MTLNRFPEPLLKSYNTQWLNNCCKLRPPPLGSSGCSKKASTIKKHRAYHQHMKLSIHRNTDPLDPLLVGTRCLQIAPNTQPSRHKASMSIATHLDRLPFKMAPPPPTSVYLRSANHFGALANQVSAALSIKHLHPCAPVHVLDQS